MGKSLLTKLSPKSVNFMGAGGRSMAEITAFDVAGALSFGDLSVHAYYFGLAKYCLDEKATRETIIHLEKKIQTSIDVKGWQDDRGRALRLASLVLQEVGFGLVCKKCQGSGLEVNNKSGALVNENCRKCGGRGAGSFTDRQRAALSGIPKSSWSRAWISRMSCFYDYVVELDYLVSSHLKRQFS